MSCVLCERCSDLIDSDFDPECFTEEGNGPIHCETCREECPEEWDCTFDPVAAAEFNAEMEIDACD